MKIKRFGGVAIVQDPAEAVFPSMPQSALLNVKVDHVVGLAQIAGLIAETAANRGVKRKRMNLRRKANLPDIAETGSNRLEAPGFNVPPSAVTCPDCGGALWEVKDGKLLRFRCHLGHGFTADGLSEQQSRSVENALWTAMRALEESALLRRQLAMRSRQSNMTAVAARYDHDARQAENRAAIIRSVLVEDETSQVVKAVRPSPEAREHAGRMNGKRLNVSRNENHNGNGVKKKTRNRRQRSRAG
jgi:two-component system chemotaxis response regulator CheB